MKAKPPLEKVEQQHIVQFIRSLGGSVYILGTKRRATDYQGTNQTPGVPDLIAFLGHRHMYIEVKRHGGKMSPPQVAFRQQCLKAGVSHIVGTYNDVVVTFLEWGVLTWASVPSYRQPARQKRPIDNPLTLR